MALPDVLVLIQNGQLGALVQFAEGVAGMIGTGVAGTGGTNPIGIGDPRVIYSVSDAESIGITATANPFAYRQVKEFYDEAGVGSELYIMLVPDTMTQTQMYDNTNANGVKKLLAYAQGKIRIVGSFFAPPVSYVPVVTAGLDGDVYTAITKAQVTALAQANAVAPLRCVIEGRKFTGDAALLTDLRTMSNNRVAVAVGSTLNDGSASIGLLLGRVARIPVQRKVSRFKDGALPIDAAYVGSTAVDGSIEVNGKLGMMHDKGYIVLRTFPTATGYRFNGDPVCAPITDDYNGIARGRVIDKAHIIAYATYLQELDDETLETATGTLDPGLVKYLESKITVQIDGLMTANKQISSCAASIDPNQNVKLTSELEVVLNLTPVGYNGIIKVKLGFS